MSRKIQQKHSEKKVARGIAGGDAVARGEGKKPAAGGASVAKVVGASAESAGGTAGGKSGAAKAAGSGAGQGELIAAPKGTKPIDQEFATAVQLSAFLPADMDDAALRRLADEKNLNPATDKPWIPKPKGGKYRFAPTIKGVLAWYEHKATTVEGRGLPRQCASMTDMEAVFGMPVEMQKYARAHGCPEAFEASNRVNVLPLMKFFGPILKKIFTGGAAQIKDLEGFEDLDKDIVQARVLKQTEIAAIRENAIANRQLYTRTEIEKEVGARWGSVADSWKNYERETGAKLKSLLTGAGVDLDVVTRAITIAAEGVKDPITKLRQALALDPAPATGPETPVSPDVFCGSDI